MRLLDRIAQSRAPLLIRQGGALWRLPSACDFSADIGRCPLRYVLTDELLRLCVELAYSEGDDLSACLDLVHFPAEQLWIEWNEEVKRAELARLIPECVLRMESPTSRKGVFISAQPGSAAAFRCCSLRTFWSPCDRPAHALVAAAETQLDLEHHLTCGPVDAFLDGGLIAVRDPADAGVDAVLQHAGFRLDPLWQRYYRSTAHGPARDGIICACLAGVAFDVPIILALFLLMALRSGLRQVPVHHARLNAKRSRLHRPALLAHIEVSCPVLTAADPPASGAHMARGAPRFHHVRGHLVRRGDALFWRRPHWRGHLRLGCVRSRTVELLPPSLTPAGMAASGHGSGDSA